MALVGEPALVREDAEINFDWGAGSPGEVIPADGFSARWTGEAWVAGRAYAYLLTADDGARFYVDGHLVIDAWPAQPGQTYSALMYLAEGNHTFVVEYFEALEEARIRLWAEMRTNP